MSLRRTLLVTVVLVALMGIAGCSGDSGGTSGSPASSPDVRKVDQPLDPKTFIADPCSLAPRAALAKLGYPEPGEPTSKDNSTAGPKCAWFAKGGDTPLATFLLIIRTGSPEGSAGGLRALYGSHDDGQPAFLDDAPDVGGYQAVYADLRDRRPKGVCELHVGIADDLDFSIATQGYSGEKDSCAAANALAAVVVDTMKKGGS